VLSIWEESELSLSMSVRAAAYEQKADAAADRFKEEVELWPESKGLQGKINGFGISETQQTG